jgi:hypothetical protein
MVFYYVFPSFGMFSQEKSGNPDAGNRHSFHFRDITLKNKKFVHVIHVCTYRRTLRTIFSLALHIPWRDSISRPKAPVSSVAGGDDTTTLRTSLGYYENKVIGEDPVGVV